MILLFLDLQGALFHSPLELTITVNSIQSQKHLGICLPTAGSQTWVRSDWEFFPHKWGIEPPPMAMNPAHQVQWKANQSLPQGFHSCMIVRSPKLVSSEDRTGARVPSASYCFTEGVSSPFKHCATSAGNNWHISRINNRTLARLYRELDLFKR